MKILLVKPNEYAVEAEIDNGLRAMQGVVGGHIELLPCGSDPAVLVMKEEGKLLGLDDNRAIYDARGNVSDVIAGTFFVCGVKGEEFASLSPALMEKYKQRYFEPEIMVEYNGKLRAIKVSAPEHRSISEQLAEGEKQAARENRDRPAPGGNDKDKGAR